MPAITAASSKRKSLRSGRAERPSLRFALLRSAERSAAGVQADAVEAQEARATVGALGAGGAHVVDAGLGAARALVAAFALAFALAGEVAFAGDLHGQAAALVGLHRVAGGLAQHHAAAVDVEVAGAAVANRVDAHQRGGVADGGVIDDDDAAQIEGLAGRGGSGSCRLQGKSTASMTPWATAWNTTSKLALSHSGKRRPPVRIERSW